jgi:hypothetical protein
MTSALVEFLTPLVNRQQQLLRLFPRFYGPQEWVPPMPRPCVGPPYQCVLYERSDNDIIWKGWAIGKKLGCLD